MLIRLTRFALFLALAPALAFADGTLNDASTTARLGGVGNYLFRGVVSGESARRIEDAASSFVEIISFSQSAREDEEGASIVIPFRAGSSRLSRDSFDALDDVAAELKATAGLRADITGYADGSAGETADALSSARARAVMEALRARGVPESKVFWSGRGGPQALSQRAEIRVR